jgi:sRNA-binding protein
MKTLTLSKPMNPARIKPPAKPKPGSDKSKLTIQQLEDSYPVFKNNQPLAIGIHHQLFDAGYGQQDIIRCLYAWTRTTNYLKACAAPDSVRFNLNGSESGEVLPTARKWAQAILDKRSTRQVRP